VLLLNEIALQDLITQLVARLNGQVTAVNAIATDGVVLDQVDTTNAVLDYVPPLRAVNFFPTIAVAEQSSELVDDTGFGATGRHTFTVLVIHQHADAGLLAKMLRRYRIAVANAIMEPQRQFGSQWAVVCKGTVPGPTLGVNEDPREWLSVSGVVFELRDEQQG
jgi:hypothetical protein